MSRATARRTLGAVSAVNIAGPPALSPMVRTERLTLRPFEEPDRGSFIAVHERSWATHLAPWSPLLDGDPPDFDGLFTQQLARSTEGHAAGSACRLAAFDQHDALVGAFNLSNIVRGVFQSADAGWWLSVDHLRRGYAAEAVKALVSLALAPPREGSPLDGVRSGLGLHRVQCAVIPSNAPSLAVAQRAGFRREGLARNYLKIHGRWQNHVLLAVTVEDGAP